MVPADHDSLEFSPPFREFVGRLTLGGPEAQDHSGLGVVRKGQAIDPGVHVGAVVVREAQAVGEDRVEAVPVGDAVGGHGDDEGLHGGRLAQARGAVLGGWKPTPRTAARGDEYV